MHANGNQIFGYQNKTKSCPHDPSKRYLNY